MIASAAGCHLPARAMIDLPTLCGLPGTTAASRRQSRLVCVMLEAGTCTPLHLSGAPSPSGELLQSMAATVHDHIAHCCSNCLSGTWAGTKLSMLGATDVPASQVSPPDLQFCALTGPQKPWQHEAAYDWVVAAVSGHECWQG